MTKHHEAHFGTLDPGVAHEHIIKLTALMRLMLVTKKIAETYATTEKDASAKDAYKCIADNIDMTLHDTSIEWHINRLKAIE